MYEKYIKRFFDILISFLVLVVLSPFFALVALSVRIFLGTPVIFRQKRPGKDEKIFVLYKFRTMTDEKDKNGELLPDEIRLTKFGKLLRTLSIDELPEFFNILKGDMSLIGPRPLLVSYIPLYNEKQHRRHEVRPGLSGLAQSHGRNLLSWEDKFELDVEYVDNITFLTDAKIVLTTIVNVIRRDGINAENSATAKPFTGTKNNESSEPAAIIK
ncbi:MAG: sugar transferase [Clostridiales bacterium]|nr:sugar transferase [Clostridiales bacterium]